jgi:hypothetical protein
MKTAPQITTKYRAANTSDDVCVQLKFHETEARDRKN